MNREPVLAGIGENPVYRAMLFETRTPGLWFRMGPSGRGIVLALAFFLFSFLLSSLIPVLIILVLVFRRRRRGAAGFFRLSDMLLADLLQAPLVPRDWTNALWAYATLPRGQSAAPAALASYLAWFLFVALLILSASGAMSTPYITLVCGFAGILIASLLGTFAPSPTAPLPVLSKRLVRYRKYLVRQHRYVWRALRVVLFMMVFAFCFIILRSWALSPSAPQVDLFEWIVPLIELMARPRAPYISFLGFLVSTIAIGLWRRVYVRRNREKFLQSMDQEIAKILVYLRLDSASRAQPESGRRIMPRLGGSVSRMPLDSAGNSERRSDEEPRVPTSER